MVALAAKLAIGSIGGLALAGMLGAGLANYTESGAFAFYKQPHMTAWEPAQTAEAAPAPETTYPGSYGLYTVTPRSQVDDIYPVRDMVVFDDPVEPREPAIEAPPPEPVAEQPRQVAQPVAPSETVEASTADAWVTPDADDAPAEAPAEPVSAIY